MTKLDDLYALLRALTGIERVRDVRLERVAADRALEARYQVGTTSTEFITHPTDQLIARTFVWQGFPTNRVGENATWHYYPPTWVDPIDAAVDATLPDGSKVGWWNSAPHRANLMDSRFTHWGIGLHREPGPPGAADRWYFITTFAGDMVPLVARLAQLDEGKHRGWHLRADGGSIGTRLLDVTGNAVVSCDARQEWPGRGPMLHILAGKLRTMWVPESAGARLVEP